MASVRAAPYRIPASGAIDREATLRRMDAVAHILDTAFVLPGTRQRVGLDAVIGLVPGVGDLLTTLLSSYIIWEARRLGVPNRILGRMLGNLAIEAVAGMVPVAGDIFDAFFRVNKRNMRIIHAYLDGEAPRDERAIIDADYRILGDTR